MLFISFYFIFGSVEKHTLNQVMNVKKKWNQHKKKNYCKDVKNIWQSSQIIVVVTSFSLFLFPHIRFLLSAHIFQFNFEMNGTKSYKNRNNNVNRRKQWESAWRKVFNKQSIKLSLFIYIKTLLCDLSFRKSYMFCLQSKNGKKMMRNDRRKNEKEI